MKQFFLIFMGIALFGGQLFSQRSNYYNQPDLLFKEAIHHFDNQQYQRSINLFSSYLDEAANGDKGKLTEAQYRVALASLRLDRKEGEGLMVIFADQNPSSVYTNTVYYEL